ncbi:kelch-like ECH-associated protein 1B [Anneissia japonica]|uniref:kelch-like ECH-associated protein 1B n=1 Tax=Anneissia japonica TaxID=1529436 RepID=UPI0014256F19|nr:kelch-like ECH-associated protein 1B [Anneissia japonica]XP_033109240.1 kelch-like ECH-associated protein 1B [Anneissia japonica]XP_033109241.1 kelch-like ECH-associated protein 1B [Anneissia japonica]
MPATVCHCFVGNSSLCDAAEACQCSPDKMANSTPTRSKKDPLNCNQTGEQEEHSISEDITFRKACNGSVIFKSNRHPHSAFKQLNELRQSKTLCDVTLVVETVKFHAHKCVLAASSLYFKAMFTGGFDECEKRNIELKDIHPCCFSQIIDFMYTSEITITECNVLELLPKAIMFHLKDVIDACSMFLEQELDPSNAIGISLYAEQHGLMDLQQKARDFVCRNFNKVSENDEFLNLNLREIVTLIKHDKLNVWCESEVYNACIRWVRHDEEKRKACFDKLLGGGIRCEHLTPDFLRKQLEKCDILKSDPKCKDILSKYFKELTLHKPPPRPKRNPIAACVIYTAGGYLRQSLTNMECYCPEDDRWYRLAYLPEPRSGLSAATIHGFFYAVGGRNNTSEANTDSNRLDVYNPLTNQWHSRAPMSVPRNRVGVAVLDGQLYAVGGSQGCHQHSSVERYDPDKDRWESIASMKTRRLGVVCAIVNRLLYAVGGYDGQYRLSSVECYHPENDEWISVSPMNTKRSGAGVTSLGDHIYAVGGYDGTNQLNSVERYDVETDTWEFIAPMNSRRSALSVDVVGGKLYALGGYDGHEFLCSVECYDPETGKWTVVTNMTSGRSGAGVAVGMEPCRTGLCGVRRGGLSVTTNP